MKSIRQSSEFVGNPSEVTRVQQWCDHTAGHRTGKGPPSAGRFLPPPPLDPEPEGEDVSVSDTSSHRIRALLVSSSMSGRGLFLFMVKPKPLKLLRLSN